jgi:antitoxin (DNA-binding transcriptional repressor) of toxin-antitoxin stability system
MTTISTVDLRNNLADYINRLSAGESFQLTYRKKSVARLEPTIQPTYPPGDIRRIMAAVDALDHMDVPEHIRNDPRSIKEMIAEARDNDLR